VVKECVFGLAALKELRGEGEEEGGRLSAGREGEVVVGKKKKAGRAKSIWLVWVFGTLELLLERTRRVEDPSSVGEIRGASEERIKTFSRTFGDR